MVTTSIGQIVVALGHLWRGLTRSNLLPLRLYTTQGVSTVCWLSITVQVHVCAIRVLDNSKYYDVSPNS